MEYKAKLVIFPRRPGKFKNGDSTAEELASSTQVQGDYMPITREKPVVSLVKVTEEMKAFRATELTRCFVWRGLTSVTMEQGLRELLKPGRKIRSNLGHKDLIFRLLGVLFYSIFEGIWDALVFWVSWLFFWYFGETLNAEIFAVCLMFMRRIWFCCSSLCLIVLLFQCKFLLLPLFLLYIPSE